jgi:hypothetical protein
MLIVMTQDATEVQPNYTIDAVIEVADWTGKMLIKQGRAKAAMIRVVHRKFPQWMVGQVVNPDRLLSTQFRVMTCRLSPIIHR